MPTTAAPNTATVKAGLRRIIPSRVKRTMRRAAGTQMAAKQGAKTALGEDGGDSSESRERRGDLSCGQEDVAIIHRSVPPILRAAV